MNILLVTEDKELAKTVRESLADSTFRLAGVARNTREATESYQQIQPSLVIVETFLPGSSGLEVMKDIKRINENCLFLMLSRLRTRFAIERAFRLGAQDVLPYPCEKEILRHTILHRMESGDYKQP